jgi:transcriptional regulator with XRE-family HTH domain
MRAVTVKRRLGQNVHKLRVAAGLTQNRLSELAEIDRSFLQRIEAGSSNPTTEILLRLKRALNCSWDVLLAELD